MSEFKWKNTIGEGAKMFWKYQLAVWLSIQNLYSHFTIVNRKCECFGRIVGLWCLMPLSTIFQLYRSGQFYWWMKPE